MIQITPQMRVVAAVEPADFRRGIDGLARLCKDVRKHDPFNGWVFVLRNRSATALKILVYDGQGFWLCHKWLSSGHFRWWPAGRPSVDGARAATKTLTAHQMQVLLSAGNPEATQAGAGVACDRPGGLTRPCFQGCSPLPTAADPSLAAR